MSELDDIKKRASARREYAHLDLDWDDWKALDAMVKEAEADLDRAIATVDEWKVRALETARLYGELREARAAVLKLRDALSKADPAGSWGSSNVLNDTESYEQYRTAPDAG